MSPARTNKLNNSDIGLNEFQSKMYKHLIEWKRQHITLEKDEKGRETFLPKHLHDKFPLIYPPIVPYLKEHLKMHPFKLHQFFHHVASSQAAAINLFMPLLLNPKANEVLRNLKKDFSLLNTNDLFHGFRFEYWDGKGDEKGLLGDHTPIAGTDADVAISYFNKNNEPCLWLIEHKLTEREFTECGAYKSRGRDRAKHLCSSSPSEILSNKSLCYYHDIKKYNYWDLTKKHQTFFANLAHEHSCPFRSGLNQLWRNQLLSLALEDTGIYRYVYFSIIHHVGNGKLDPTICKYRELINNNPKFSILTSTIIIQESKNIESEELRQWINWYFDLYLDIK